VYKAICKRSREVVVLKCYLMSSICELYQHQIYREVRLHSSCNHENIINLFAAFQVRMSSRQAGGDAGCMQSAQAEKAVAHSRPAAGTLATGTYLYGEMLTELLLLLLRCRRVTVW
jgi:hypothetical protein